MTKNVRNLIKKIQKLEGVEELQRVSFDYGTNDLVIKVRVQEGNCEANEPMQEECPANEYTHMVNKLLSLEGSGNVHIDQKETTFEIVVEVQSSDRFVELVKKSTEIVFEEYGDNVIEREFREKKEIIFRIKK